MSPKDQWLKFPTIESQLPIKLKGHGQIDYLEATCSDCKVPILQQDTHGEVILTAIGAKVRMVNRCLLCGKFSFMSGNVLIIEDGAWHIAFPPPGTPMVNPWTGEVYPVRKVST